MVQYQIMIPKHIPHLFIYWTTPLLAIREVVPWVLALTAALVLLASEVIMVAMSSMLVVLDMPMR